MVHEHRPGQVIGRHEVFPRWGASPLVEQDRGEDPLEGGSVLGAHARCLEGGLQLGPRGHVRVDVRPGRPPLRQVVLPLAFKILGPRSHVRMTGSRTHGKSRVHGVACLRVGPGANVHGANHSQMVALLGELGQEVRDLEVPGLRRDGRGHAFHVGCFRIEGVDVAHAAFHVKKDDVVAKGPCSRTACHRLG